MGDSETVGKPERPRPRIPYKPVDFEFVDVLHILWRRKVLLAAVMAVCALLAYGLHAVSPPPYEGVVLLLVSQSKVGSGGVIEASVPTLSSLIQSRGLAAQVIDELDLRATVPGITPASFVENTLVVEQPRETKLIRLRVRLPAAELATRAANRLAELAVDRSRAMNQQDTVSARDFIKQQLDQTSADLERVESELLEARNDVAVDLLERQFANLVDPATELEEARYRLAHDLAVQERDGADERLEQARSDLLDFDTTAQLPIMQRNLQMRLSERTLLEEAAVQSAIDLASAQARFERASEQLVEHERILTLSSSIVDEPKLLETARRSQPEGLLDLNLRTETLNPTYQQLEAAVLIASGEMAGLQERQRAINDRLQANAAELAALQTDVATKESVREDLQQSFDIANREYVRLFQTSNASVASALSVAEGDHERTLAELADVQRRLYDGKIRLDRLVLEHELTRSAYRHLSDEYEQARLRIASRSAELQLIDAATTPSRRVAGLSGYLGVGLALGLVFGAFGVLLGEYVARRW